MQRVAAVLLTAALVAGGCLGVPRIQAPTDTPPRPRVDQSSPPTAAPTTATATPTQQPPAPATPPTSSRTATPGAPPAKSEASRPSPATATATATATAPVTAPPAGTPPVTVGTAPTGQTQPAQVVRVVDGDTIRVRIAGTEHAVRYIGIDTPETVDPRRPVEWMGREAAAANRRLVEGRTVLLERDVSETDRYDRLLRYIWVSEGSGWLLVNLALVAGGFAHVSTYPPDVKYVDLYLDAQRQARRAGRGLWGVPPPTPRPAPEPTPKPRRGGSCDPAYPTVCIPPSPPDLDCGDIGHRRFKVLSPDPHRFDGDFDGLGCES